MSAETTCSFCDRAAARAVTGRRMGAEPQVICAACADALAPIDPMAKDAPAEACDFCDHPHGGHARANGRNVTICGDCLAFARQVLRDETAGASGDADEAHLDPEQLWSDLTPAPRPDVDPNSPATAHADLATAFYAMGLVDDARRELKLALDLDPLHALALHLLEKLPVPSRRT